MKTINKIVFVTGTRADYGKLKPLIKASEAHFETYVFVCGMHLLEEYGHTYKEILKDCYQNIYCANDIIITNKMDVDLASTIMSFSQYITKVKPDLIIVHGDRGDALAGAITGMLNNILVGHVEGGEVTGTVDEAIRHAISKMAQLHFVANYESKVRIMQLGEKVENIFTIGSPDIDIMLSELPKLKSVKSKNAIHFDSYGILMYHPVITEYTDIDRNIKTVIEAIKFSNRNYIIIYPNNDLGSEIIIHELEKLNIDKRYHLFKSLPFEEFLCLLKHAEVIVGNSSVGIREACVYGIPVVDIGTRQQGRYDVNNLRNIQHTIENKYSILECLNKIGKHRLKSSYFGTGNSAELFIEAVVSLNKLTTQKKFVDTSETQQAIQRYINEVCF